MHLWIKFYEIRNLLNNLLQLNWYLEVLLSMQLEFNLNWKISIHSTASSRLPLYPVCMQISLLTYLKIILDQKNISASVSCQLSIQNVHKSYFSDFSRSFYIKKHSTKWNLSWQGLEYILSESDRLYEILSVR